MYTVEIWHLGRFCSVDDESEVCFVIGVKGANLFCSKVSMQISVTDKVESWHVGRFCSVDYESEVVFAIGVKGVELLCSKVSMQFYFDRQS